LLVFRDMAEAVAGVEEIDRYYARHHRAARELAEDVLDFSPMSPRDVGRMRLLGPYPRCFWNDTRTTYPEPGVIQLPARAHLIGLQHDPVTEICDTRAPRVTKTALA